MHSTLLPQIHISSVIDDRCDIRTAFRRVISFYDPNRGRNRKSRVLDSTYSNLWDDKDYKLFGVHKTNNLTGYVKDSKFDIIVYEAPRNKTFYNHSLDAADVYRDVIERYGFVIVKVNDFKEKGSDKLRGSFDLIQAFHKNKFSLFDNIIYRHNTGYNPSFESTNRAEIVHSYFLVFKPI